MICLDTDVLIDFLRGEEKIVKKIKELKEKNINLSTTSINTFELYKGAISSSYNDTEIINNLINNLKILNFEIKASKKTADIFNKLKNQRTSVDSLDLMIASIAITNNHSLLTRNTKHFKNIPELILENF